MAETKQDIYYTTGCTLADLVIGGGMGMGFRGGVLTGIEGMPGAGKSYLCAESVGHNANKLKGFKWLYIDKERRFRFDTTKLYGVQVCDVHEDPPETVQALDATVGSTVRKFKAPAMVVIDSLDAFSDDEKEKRSDARIKQLEAGKEVKDEGTYGMAAAKFYSQEFFRTKMTPLAQSGVCLLALMQMRANVGAGLFEKKVKHSGSITIDHWCDTIVSLRLLEKYWVKGTDGQERHVGSLVELSTTKSTTPRPGRSCVYPIYFDYGIDNVGANIDYLFDLRKPDGQRSLISEKANNILWGGEKPTLPAMVEWLKEQGAYDRAKDDKKQTKDGKSALNNVWLMDWIASQPDLSPLFAGKFGKTLTRAELIDAVLASPDMEKELERRVIEKWEANEALTVTNRPRKFK